MKKLRGYLRHLHYAKCANCKQYELCVPYMHYYAYYIDDRTYLRQAFPITKCKTREAGTRPVQGNDSPKCAPAWSQHFFASGR